MTQITVSEHGTVTTEYVQGRKMRWESVQATDSGAHTIATILDFGEQSRYVADLQAKVYTDSRYPDFLTTLAVWIQHSPRVRQSGKTVDVYIETTDTGERRQAFGRVAQHLITRERRVAQAGACSGPSESVRDGWYIAVSQPRPRNEAYHLAFNGRPCRDTMVTHTSRAEQLATEGFPVLETTTEGAEPSSQNLFSITREVIAFSEQPIDRTLFEPPKDFRRVDALPGQTQMSWTERIGFEWRQLERSFESWFD